MVCQLQNQYYIFLGDFSLDMFKITQIEVYLRLVSRNKFIVLASIEFLKLGQESWRFVSCIVVGLWQAFYSFIINVLENYELAHIVEYCIV